MLEQKKYMITRKYLYWNDYNSFFLQNTTNGDPYITTKNIIAVNIEVNNNNNNNVNEVNLKFKMRDCMLES